jgi:hypothetical protein
MLKKLASLATAGLLALGIASTANAASGFASRDDWGNTYTSLTLDSGRNVTLYPTSRRCGGKGTPYDFMTTVINSGQFDAWVDQECGPLIRVCLSKGIEICSTYSRIPIQRPNSAPRYGYDNGF